MVEEDIIPSGKVSLPLDSLACSGSLKTSTTMTSPSVRRSLMRAEDEPITLKKKACCPVVVVNES